MLNRDDRGKIQSVMRLAEWAPEHSKAMFGNSNMLTVILFIAHRDEPQFSTTEVVAATGIDPTLVHPLLARLKRGEVIDQIGRVPGQRTLLFQRRPSPYWELAHRLVEQFIEDHPDTE